MPHPALRIVLGIRRRGERQVGGPAESSSLRTHGRFEATKASTDVLTRALALELHERTITVNAVSLESHRSCASNDLQLWKLLEGVRSRPGLARKPSSRPGRYCICRSRVLTSAVS